MIKKNKSKIYNPNLGFKKQKSKAVRERFIKKRRKNRQMSVLPLDLSTYSKNRHFSFFPPICHKMRQNFYRLLSDKQSHFKVNDCTEQKTLSIHLELIQWFTVETPSNFGRMFRICFCFPRERFQKKLHLPFQVVKISSHGTKVLLWKILVYSKYIGEEKKY